MVKDYCLSAAQKRAMQVFYLACRELLREGVVPPICVQRSFEAATCGLTGVNTWRATHISAAAMVEAAEGFISKIQRAHGVLGDRMDRYDRTLAVLTGKEKSFDDWWAFYCYHDATVLITKEEHATNLKFAEEELWELPSSEMGMFENTGFSFKMRKGKELTWIREQLEHVASLREMRDQVRFERMAGSGVT
jgi:hypothetical protein